MLLVYVAGKYRASTEWELEQNIRRAEEIARQLWAEGFAVICPHKNTAHFGGVLEDPQEDNELWLMGDFEMVKRCDVLFRMEGKSNGADREVALAKEKGIPVFYSLSQLIDYKETRA